jgi:hypothetical protein
MPNTLAALPRSQNATPRELVSGKKDFFAVSFWEFAIVWLSDDRGVAWPPGTAAALVRSGAELL